MADDPSSSSGPQHTPCAACAYLGWMCPPNCSLAPYFQGESPDSIRRSEHRFGTGWDGVVNYINHVNSLRALQQRAESNIREQRRRLQEQQRALMPPPKFPASSPSTAQYGHHQATYFLPQSSSTSTAMAEQSSSSGPQYPPCAACAYLGWMCPPNCALAPYFQGRSPESIRRSEHRFGTGWDSVVNYINHVNSLRALQQRAESNIREQRRRLQEQQRALMPPPTFPASSPSTAQYGHHQATYFPPQSSSTLTAMADQSSSSGPQYPPCAACAYLGWMCPPNCALAPYFQGRSPERIRMSEDLFGTGWDGVVNYINHMNSLRALQQRVVSDREQRRRLLEQQRALMPPPTFPASSPSTAQYGHHQATYFPPQSSSTSTAMADQSSSSGPQYPPCAACAYLGWICPPNCALAPYFQGRSPERIRMSEDLFGTGWDGVVNYINHMNSLRALQQRVVSDRERRRRLQEQQRALMPPTTFPATMQGNEASSSSTAQDGHHQATYLPANPWHQANSLFGNDFAGPSYQNDGTVQHQPAAPSHQIETPALHGAPVAIHPPANKLMPPPPIPGTKEPAAAAQCTACRFLERTCLPGCPLAPYFPANQPELFQILQRFVGEKNLRLIEWFGPQEREDIFASIMSEARERAHQAQQPPTPGPGDHDLGAQDVAQYIVDDDETAENAATTSRDGMELSGSNAEQHQQALDLPADNSLLFGSDFFGSDPLGAGHYGGAIVYETDARSVDPVSDAGGMDPSLNQDQMLPMTLQDELTEQDLAQFLPDAPPNDEND